MFGFNNAPVILGLNADRVEIVVDVCRRNHFMLYIQHRRQYDVLVLTALQYSVIESSKIDVCFRLDLLIGPKFIEIDSAAVKQWIHGKCTFLVWYFYDFKDLYNIVNKFVISRLLSDLIFCCNSPILFSPRFTAPLNSLVKYFRTDRSRLKGDVQDVQFLLQRAVEMHRSLQTRGCSTARLSHLVLSYISQIVFFVCAITQVSVFFIFDEFIVKCVPYIVTFTSCQHRRLVGSLPNSKRPTFSDATICKSWLDQSSSGDGLSVNLVQCCFWRRILSSACHCWGHPHSWTGCFNETLSHLFCIILLFKYFQ